MTFGGCGRIWLQLLDVVVFPAPWFVSVSILPMSAGKKPVSSPFHAQLQHHIGLGG